MNVKNEMLIGGSTGWYLSNPLLMLSSSKPWVVPVPWAGLRAGVAVQLWDYHFCPSPPLGGTHATVSANQPLLIGSFGYSLSLWLVEDTTLYVHFTKLNCNTHLWTKVLTKHCFIIQYTIRPGPFCWLTSSTLRRKSSFLRMTEHKRILVETLQENTSSSAVFHTVLYLSCNLHH